MKFTVKRIDQNTITLREVTQTQKGICLFPHSCVNLGMYMFHMKYAEKKGIHKCQGVYLKGDDSTIGMKWKDNNVAGKVKWVWGYRRSGWR